MKNVCTEVVKNNLCIGCGLCAGICPHENLRIEFNEFGEYNPYETSDGCINNCSLCLDICPFYDNDENEDTLGKRLFSDIPGIKHRPETGYYLNSFVGYSNQNSHRKNGASGGLATWTLEKLLTDNLVDHVVCVSPNDDQEKLFKFKICNTSEEVRNCSRSCYYPVETSEVISYVLRNDGHYAIIGLPCVCKAVRLAQEKIPILRKRIRFVMGLVCGQTKSKFFVEYICALGGGDPHCLNQIRFRIKDPNRPASDFGMRFVCNNEQGSRQECVVFWSEGIGRIWGDRYFTLNACNFCDDVFAECADAVFMDAWLPEYSHDSRGHSIIIVRNNIIADLLTDARNGELFLKSLNIDQVVRSQQGVLDIKRGELRYCSKLATAVRQAYPNKRMKLCHPVFLFGRRKVIRLTWLLSRLSAQAWVDSKKNYKSFEKSLKGVPEKLEKAESLYNHFRIPNALLKRIQKVFT